MLNNLISYLDHVYQGLTLISIVIKPDPEFDPAKGPGPGFHRSTRVNLEKF